MNPSIEIEVRSLPGVATVAKTIEDEIDNKECSVGDVTYESRL